MLEPRAQVREPEPREELLRREERLCVLMELCYGGCVAAVLTPILALCIDSWRLRSHTPAP